MHISQYTLLSTNGLVNGTNGLIAGWSGQALVYHNWREKAHVVSSVRVAAPEAWHLMM